MNKHIYIVALYNERANLLKVPIKKETPKTFVFSRPVTHIIGDDIPLCLFGKQMHKRDCLSYPTAEGALKGLRNLMKENMREKKRALQQAESELGYVERFKLTTRGYEGNE